MTHKQAVQKTQQQPEENNASAVTATGSLSETNPPQQRVRNSLTDHRHICTCRAAISYDAQRSLEFDDMAHGGSSVLVDERLDLDRSDRLSYS